MMKIVCFFVFALSSLFAEIQELDRFSNLEKYLSKDTLLILDIDDTLLIPTQMLGCDEWFCQRMKEKTAKCGSPKDALEDTLAEWEGIRHLTQMEIVEPGTETMIQSLQARGYPIMGLTTQGLALATRTHFQLKQNRVQINLTSPIKEDCYLLVNSHGVLYRNGILFTSGSSKGKSLFGLFDQMNYFPKKIVFVNDKKSHLEDVEEEAKLRKMEFLGLRYAYSDQKKAAFSYEVAEFQYNHSSFGRILSDEEAKIKMGIDHAELSTP